MVVSSCYRNPRSFRPLMDRLISRARVPLIWTIKITEGVMVSGDRSAIAELLDIAAQRERPSRDDLPWGNDERLRPCGCGDSGPATPYIGGSRATAPGIEHRGPACRRRSWATDRIVPTSNSPRGHSQQQARSTPSPGSSTLVNSVDDLRPGSILDAASFPSPDPVHIIPTHAQAGDKENNGAAADPTFGPHPSVKRPRVRLRVRCGR